MRSLKIAATIAALVAAIFIFYTQFAPNPASESVTEPGAQSDAAALPEASDNGTSVDAQAVESDSSDAQTTQADSAAEDNAEQQNSANTSNPSDVSLAPNPNYPELFAHEVGLVDISEDEYLALIDRLKNDPYLLNEVLNELRIESDPARLKRLAALLGETGSAEVLPVIEELVYSNAIDTRKAALDVLSRVAPKNPEAYNIANTILGSEADSTVLVSTMNVLARPINASAEAKATAISQIMPLAQHESAAVRRHSVSLLPRLTNDASLSPLLYTALSDTDASVRKAATYSLASHPFQPPEAIERLLEMAEDPNEDKGARKGALFALGQMAPSEEITARVKQAKLQMRNESLRR